MSRRLTVRLQVMPDKAIVICSRNFVTDFVGATSLYVTPLGYTITKVKVDRGIHGPSDHGYTESAVTSHRSLYSIPTKISEEHIITITRISQNK